MSKAKHCPKCGGRIRFDLVDGMCRACMLQGRHYEQVKSQFGAGGCLHGEAAHKTVGTVIGLFITCRWCGCQRPAGMKHEEGVVVIA